MLLAALMTFSSSFAAEAENKKAPDFTLKDMQGNEVSLSDYKGKVVLVNFWATWCPPCIEEMPSMEKLYKKLGSADFVILAINIEPDAHEIVEEFLAKRSYTYPILLDGESKVQQLYGAYRLPETVIVNRQGEIVNRIVGGRDWMDEGLVNILSFMVKG